MHKGELRTWRARQTEKRKTERPRYGVTPFFGRRQKDLSWHKYMLQEKSKTGDDRIFIPGDINRNFRCFSTNNIPEQKQMDKDDYVIICGDFEKGNYAKVIAFFNLRGLGFLQFSLKYNFRHCTLPLK